MPLPPLATGIALLRIDFRTFKIFSVHRALITLGLNWMARSWPRVPALGSGLLTHASNCFAPSFAHLQQSARTPSS